MIIKIIIKILFNKEITILMINYNIIYHNNNKIMSLKEDFKVKGKN